MASAARLELHTVAVLPDGCFSVLLWDGRPFAVSVERTFDDGRPVIQAGEYECVRTTYHKGGYETFEIIIKGHTRVLFHKGNTEDDSLACVLVAEAFGVMGQKVAVLDSRTGFGQFMEATAGLERFTMKVTGR